MSTKHFYMSDRGLRDEYFERVSKGAIALVVFYPWDEDLAWDLWTENMNTLKIDDGGGALDDFVVVMVDSVDEGIMLCNAMRGYSMVYEDGKPIHENT